jgi:hypothetical protein
MSLAGLPRAVGHRRVSCRMRTGGWHIGYGNTVSCHRQYCGLDNLMSLPLPSKYAAIRNKWSGKHVRANVTRLGVTYKPWARVLVRYDIGGGGSQQ